MDRVRIADLIMERLHDKYGVKYISLITGNGALVLNDALAKNGKIKPICVHHEQDAGYIALGHSKYTNKLSVVTPTTGCAGTNCITPLLAAYQDHVPILFLSGNVALKQTTRYHELNRQIKLKKIGTQEVDIIEIVKPLTKYAVMIERPNTVLAELDRAIQIALAPPMGPVWIDLPADIGSTLAENAPQEHLPVRFIEEKNEHLEAHVNELIQDFKHYERVLCLCGNGVRLSDTRNDLKEFLEKYQLPAVFTYGGMDLLPHDHPLNIGRIGVKGDRAGNFAVQNCDYLLVLGSCLNTPQVGYMGDKFAPQAKKTVVDIDLKNHAKDIGVNINFHIKCNLKDFFKCVL